MVDVNKNDTADNDNIIFIRRDEEEDDAKSDSVCYNSIWDCDKITRGGGGLYL